jgi:hypothetical protein
VHGLGRLPPAETTFIIEQINETGHAPGRFHYWFPEGQVTTLQPSVQRSAPPELCSLCNKRAPTVCWFSQNDQRFLHL